MPNLVLLPEQFLELVEFSLTPSPTLRGIESVEAFEAIELRISYQPFSASLHNATIPVHVVEDYPVLFPCTGLLAKTKLLRLRMELRTDEGSMPALCGVRVHSLSISRSCPERDREAQQDK